ncbi:MAG: class I SAM-dependent methyltransferase [Rhodospirillaceae bacterium]
MSRASLGLGHDLSEYLRKMGGREDADLRALREATATHPRAQMQISPEQGQLLILLMELMGAKRTVEIGTFTGYSAMCVAKAMGPEGRVVALDVSKEFTDLARRAWDKAGIADRIDLRIAPALDSLKAMVAAGEAGRYDFAFIDADKENYDAYYEQCLVLLRKGGLIGIDNVLWSGRVIEMEDTSAATGALRALNQKIAADERVTLSMVPIGDGLTLARKR